MRDEYQRKGCVCVCVCVCVCMGGRGGGGRESNPHPHTTQFLISIIYNMQQLNTPSSLPQDLPPSFSLSSVGYGRDSVRIHPVL